jgi:20S proteasome alpha/beta subunit
MDAVMGIQGKDFVVICADTMIARSIQMLKADADKILPLGSTSMMGVSGPVGDRVAFGEYIQKNLTLYQLTNGTELSVHGAVHFTRNELAKALRRGPYQVNMLIGGVDKKGPALHYMDYMASTQPVPYGAHGYGAFFVLSTMDRHCHENMTLPQAIAVLNLCIKELQQRFLVNMPNFICKVADKDGVREVSLTGE